MSAEPEGLDPSFVFEFEAYAEPDNASQRWSTWWSVQPLCRGPEPRPDWVVTSRAAVDTELGILKTGKEADVFLIERGDPHLPESAVVMAAKRYRDDQHRSFHRSENYTAERKMRNTRDTRALARKSAYGRAVQSAQWAGAEWTALCRLWELGLPVPYPVQIDGAELLMEWITVDGETAPRLAQVRPDRSLLESYFEQVRDVIVTLAGEGLVHGDLSAYNLLAAGDRIVVIDLPQLVDLVANPLGGDLLLRDCANVCSWFGSRGLEVDEHDLFGAAMAAAW